MAGKRSATSDLNHTNWDDEDDPEESGNFSKASEDILKNRVIKIAKRRNPIGSVASSDEEKKGTFANFGGFSKSNSTSTSAALNFITNIAKESTEQPKSNGFSSTSSSAKTITSVMNPSDKSTLMELPHTEIEDSGKSKEYYAKIKGLNQSVSKWIQNHVDKNPFLNLSPIFRDYERYLDEIETLNVQSDSNKPNEFNNITFKGANVAENKDNNRFKHGKQDESITENKTAAFTFGNSNTSSSLFSFAKVNAEPSSNISTGFTFGGNTKPFTFTNVAPQTEQKEETNEDDQDEPPKVEITPVVEEGNIYTVRCKVFIKKDDKFGDRGVGNLFLKPIPDNDKVQLIVRADTNLGNLWCNFILSKNIPIQRLGKKEIVLVCLPTPEHKPPPVPVLLRVKTTEEADELLKILEKHKK